MLIPISERGIDMTVAFSQRNFDSITHFVGFALPGAEADGWNLVASVETKSFAVLIQI